MTGQRTGLPCIECDSSDAMTIYPKGDGYCFSCETYFTPRQVEDGETSPLPDHPRPPKVRKDRTVQPVAPSAVPSRGLEQSTLEYYGVGVEHSETSGEVESLVFPIYRDGKETGQKIKQLETKQYTARGSAKNPDLFGSWKCREGGKLLIITEGEEDCMSVYQLLREAGKDYNVVSLPNGGSSAAVRKHLNWIEQFDSIVLNLDNDEVGQRCATEIAEIITPGKVKIMTLPVKDANEFLLSRRSGKDYLKFLWNAKAFAPDGIINLADCWELIETEDMKPSTPYPWKGLNSKLYGIREREIVTFTAGTGVGKSAVVRELEHWLLMQTPDNIGVMALEESTERTIWGVMSVEANMNLAVKEKRIEALQNGAFTQEDKRKWFDATHGTGRIHTWDHWGSAGERNLLTKLRYMIKGLGCKWVFLDHLNILVSSMEDNGDERRAIDSIMTKLRKLCEETGAGMVLVCHLSRKAGDKGHEQGAEVSLAHLRGSQAIAQLSDGVVALERNQQAEDAKEANLTKIRVLKNRYAGPVGPCGYLAYDDNTGRLTEVFNINEYLAPSPEEAGV